MIGPNGWGYYFDRKRFHVVPTTTIVPPLFYYKYYSLTQYNVDALVNSYIYASHPSELNDIADSNPKNVVLNREILSDFKTDVDSLSPNEVQEAVRDIIYIKQFSQWGIVSLSPTPTNVLMWSHYSGKDGVCVEFDVDKFHFSKHGPFPVNYVCDLKPITLCKKNFSSAIIAQTLIKHRDWSYENEWRLIVEAQDGVRMKTPGFKVGEYDYDIERKFNYPVSAIRRVILSYDFFKNHSFIPEDSDCFFVNMNLSEKPLTSIQNLKIKLLDYIIKFKIPIGIIIMQNLNGLVLYLADIKGNAGKYKITMSGTTEYFDAKWNINPNTYKTISIIQ